MRVTATKLLDGLVLLIATKTATLSIIPAGQRDPAGLEAATWFGLASVYAGCSWACGAGRRAPVWATPLARACLLFCVFLCVCLARHFGDLGMPSPVHFFDWLSLAVCCACGALLERPSSGD
jgi:hypothetical protein